MSKNILVLVGKSASGKSTIEKCLVKLGYDKCVSCTTRPIRDGEVDGVDYYFLTDENFAEMKSKNMFLETASYRGWHYGVPIDELETKENPVLIVETHGLEQILKDSRVKPYVVFIEVNDQIRYVRQLYRGDDIIEVALRSERDKACFQGMEDKANFVIRNDEWDKEGDCKVPVHEVAKMIHLSYKSNLK